MPWKRLVSWWRLAKVNRQGDHLFSFSSFFFFSFFKKKNCFSLFGWLVAFSNTVVEHHLSVDHNEGAALLHMKAGPRSRSSRNGLGRAYPGTCGAWQARRRPRFRPRPVSQDKGLSAQGLLRLCGICHTTGDARGVHWRGQQGTDHLRPTFLSF